MFCNIKRCALVAVMVLFAAVNQGYAKEKTKQAMPGTKEYNNQVVLRVNGVEFTRATYDSYVNKAIPRMSMHKSVSGERKEQLRQAAVTEIITGELVAEEAAKDPEVAAMVSQKDVDDAIAEVVKKLPEGMTLKKILKNSNMSKDELKQTIRRDLQARHYNVKISKKLNEQADKTVDDAYAKDYYEKNLAKFVEPEKVHVRMILLKADPSGGTKVWTSVYKRAKELTDKSRAGEDFGKLAKEFSEDKQTAEKEGDLGWQHRGSMMEEIDAMTGAMKEGEVSEPFTTLYGYLVIKLEGVKPEKQKMFDEINLVNLKADLADKLAKKLYNDWLDALWAGAKIEFLADDVRLK